MPTYDEVADRLSMPLVDAMQTQRAIRRLRPDPVDDATVLRLLELATRAPTGGGRENWEWIVVRDPDVKHQLARLNRQGWSVLKRYYEKAARRDERLRRTLDAARWQADHFEEIPVVIVACLRGPRGWFWNAGETTFYGSIYPAVQNLLLAARALGLGAALTTISLWSTSLARRTLALPLSVTPCAVVPIGWPVGNYGPTTRRPVGEVVHVDRFGNQPFRP